MSDHTSLVGTTAGGIPGTATADRIFLSLNGSVLGPYTQSQLETHRPIDGSWVWQVGQSEWTAWSSSITPAVESKPEAPAARSLQDRGLAARQAATLPLRRVQAQRAVTSANQAINAAHAAIGQAVIDHAVPFASATLAAERELGEGVVKRIAAVDDAIAQEQKRLDREDPKSPVVIELRESMSTRRKQRETLVAELRIAEHRLGRAVSDESGVVELFPDLYAKLIQARQRLAAAIEAQDALKAEQVDTVRQVRTSIRAAVAVAGSVVAFIAMLVVKMLIFHPATQTNALGVKPTVSTQAMVAKSPAVVPSLSRDQLRLASVLVATSWKAFPGTTQSCTGSAAVTAITADGMVHMMTNRHVLNLDELMKAKVERGLWVGEYSVQVKFPSGRICQVLKIHPESTNIDLAMLEVDGRTLQPGVDFVMMQPVPADTELQIGDEVIAVGNPSLGEGILENTQTFGHISSLRDYDVDGVTTNLIQTDCALNHGNSGGPLLLRNGDRYFWAGINTSGASPGQGYQGLNFAISARQAYARKYWDYAATPTGVAALLTQAYHFPAATYTP